MDINVTIERIANGFIITDISNKESQKEFYPTIALFIENKILKPTQSIDKEFREFDLYGEQRQLILTITNVPKR